MTHRYELGQSVRLRKLSASSAKASFDGVYEIIRLMPVDQSGDVHYRLKSPAGERVAAESELKAAPKIANTTFGDVFRPI